MNKKILLAIILVLIFITSIGIGFFFVRIQGIDEYNAARLSTAEEKVTDECVKEGQDFLQANAYEQKVSPNANIVTKIYYNKCGHTISDSFPVNENVINMTENEVKEYYKDWNIEAFSPNEIVVKLEVQGICNEHYVLREEDEKIAVYVLDEDKNETLLEETDIVTKYLPDTDKINIKNGIYVNGKEVLNRLLEDYE